MLYPRPIARKKRRDERYTAKVRNEWRGINLRCFALRWSTRVARDDRSVPDRISRSLLCAALFSCVLINYYKSVSALAAAAYKSRNGLKRGADGRFRMSRRKIVFPRLALKNPVLYDDGKSISPGWKNRAQPSRKQPKVIAYADEIIKGCARLYTHGGININFFCFLFLSF